jgi:hypothetical protein
MSLGVLGRIEEGLTAARSFIRVELGIDPPPNTIKRLKPRAEQLNASLPKAQADDLQGAQYLTTGSGPV